MKKQNLFREMLKKQKENKIEIGSKEEWILQWLDVAEDYDEHDSYLYEDEQNNFSHYDNLYSILNDCTTLDQMENEIICYSFTDDEYNSKWKQNRIKEYYDIEEKYFDRGNLVEQLNYINDFYKYSKKYNYDIYVQNEQMVNRLSSLFRNYYLDKDIFREFRNYFEKWESKYDDKKWYIHHKDIDDRYNDELYYKNLEELKKANINFCIEPYYSDWEKRKDRKIKY